MDNHGFFQFVLFKLISLSVQLILLYILVLLCEWFAEKKGYNLFERSFLVTLVSLPILTFIIWTIIIARFKLF
ncbi:hypothetical protein COJ85_20145 [Bacillus sp. AFS076308]|uniref:hypothetical protein n=1 Tax=unclassified Bacillus (in: firmicutes) TaxID=185979 RepID=UPI000BFA2B2C|nr:MULTISPECIES: hypothetical protein [unclassified Bacillus (in: firmicutes)]PFN98690.1 hypothetical protein COJ85_20145 [Bacillus sp. AFS076308]PGV53530.1 hypothetical protein COD92_08100 [Bacillus sp. AFS037270]